MREGFIVLITSKANVTPDLRGVFFKIKINKTFPALQIGDVPVVCSVSKPGLFRHL